MAMVLTNSQNYTDIADAIRAKNFSNSTYYPNQMADAIEDLKMGWNVDINADIYSTYDSWVRPNNYPDLDSITIPNDFDGVYLTYDLNRTPNYGFIGVYVNTKTNNTTYTVERGHLENNVFITDYTVTQNKGTYFREKLNEANGMVQLWRVSSTAKITRFVFVGSGTATSAMCYNFTQPCVERRGQLPYVTDLSSYLTIRVNTSDGVFGTHWLERDNLNIGSESIVTTLYGMYAWCHRLVSVNLNWNTTDWKVTNLSYMFYQCVTLRHIDFSAWNTTNWAVTNLAHMFNSCNALRSINLSYWNTTNWKVTTLASMFTRCDSVKTIDLSTWDTTSWAVTTMASMFAGCRSLININFTNLNTTNWKITTMANMFDSCLSIKHIDLSSFDTSSWKVTTMGSMFVSCYALISVNFNGWDTSEWTTMATLSSMFSGCYSLKKLDLSSWDTSEWKVTTLSNMFVNCCSLIDLKLSWETDSWAVTTLANTFDYCRSLQSLNLSWNTSNWAVTSLAGTFRCCYHLTTITGINTWDTSDWAVASLADMFNSCISLKTLDLSDWDTSNWVVTTTASMFSWCQSLENLTIGDWDTSGWKVTTMASMFNECRSLKTIDLSNWDTSLFALTTLQSMIGACWALETLYFPTDFTATTFKVTNANYQITYSTVPCLKNCNGYPIAYNTNWTAFYDLSAESLIAIIAYLPTVTTARTLTLGVSHKNKLTAEQIAVATSKGWTVA